jgi:hypothetical protein
MDNKNKQICKGNQQMNKKITCFSTYTMALALLIAASSASASIFEFHFTGQYTLVNGVGTNIDRQAIESTLTYDDATGSGFSGSLSIDNFVTFGAAATVHDISLQRYQNTNLIVGNMLADWNGSFGLPISMVWDATGLFNAIDFGLQANDVISGTDLKRDGVVVANVGSATPASDGGTYDQGPAPLAMTTLNTTTLCIPDIDCAGNAFSGGAPFFDDGIAGSPLVDAPFSGFNVNFDIGSGNSLTVTQITTVPVPAAVWLFSSGLMGLVGFARRKKS